MAAENSVQPMVIIRRKKKHAKHHHGGSWKVAYADFVTAMMSLFIVLWLLNSSEQVKKAIGGYFQDPTGSGRQVGSDMFGSGEALGLREQDLNQLKDKLTAAMKQLNDFKVMKDQVSMTVTGEGLRIELLETDKGMFFQSGRPEPSKFGEVLLTKLAQELGKIPNRILIEGHTDSKPYAGEGGYSNWELSADRANSARRLMEAQGVRPGQVGQVRGFADQNLRKPKNPGDSSNRRISLIVEYQTSKPAVKAMIAAASAHPKG